MEAARHRSNGRSRQRFGIRCTVGECIGWIARDQLFRAVAPVAHRSQSRHDVVATAGMAALVSVTVVIGLADALQYLIVFVIPAMVVVNRSLLSRVGPDGRYRMVSDRQPVSDPCRLRRHRIHRGVDHARRPRRWPSCLDPRRDRRIRRDVRALSARGRSDRHREALGAIGAGDDRHVLDADDRRQFGDRAEHIGGLGQEFPPDTPLFILRAAPIAGRDTRGGALAVWALGTDDVAFIGRTLSMVFATPYFLLGLAVIHRLVSKWPLRRLFLIIFYIMLLLLLDWPSFAAVVGLGFAEQWLGLRRRYATGPPAKED